MHIVQCVSAVTLVGIAGSGCGRSAGLAAAAEMHYGCSWCCWCPADRRPIIIIINIIIIIDYLQLNVEEEAVQTGLPPF